MGDLMCPLPTLPKTHHFCPSQLSLDPLGPEWDCPLGSKDLEEEEGPWGGGSGLPPPGCFPGSWHQDVGLDCKGSLEGAEARAWTVYYYGLLQSCLQQAGLPETQDRSQVPRTGAQGLQGGGSLGGEGGTLSPACFPSLSRSAPSPRLWLDLEPGRQGQSTSSRQALFQRASGTSKVRDQGFPPVPRRPSRGICHPCSVEPELL